ncbi:hypothetical protein [Roseburia sp. MSJ-14]|uniref:hypothetical protein n=1 Tax=Roseburia sp. MSJ-14 TaxID=2841514 RepID=UPI001C0F4132|nr:hypothetical protein [Roseburia sp. MSJ-14]MBU5474627.1 hypothetical protein [Roseburia sp. MSJ-14]
MEKKDEREIEVLQGRIKTLEKEQESYEYEAKSILREEEEEDMWITQSHLLVEQMRAECSSEDEKIQRLLYEKQDMLSAFRRKKIEFDSQFREEVKQRRSRMENDIEELHTRLSKIQCKQKNAENEKDTEGKYV